MEFCLAESWWARSIPDKINGKRKQDHTGLCETKYRVWVLF